ncbi:MAG TPA: DinB family protein [Thermoanaerobaculia bacterium]|nr:DinB family protein [Thermoanaerobaculia bacterium]
MSQDLSTIRNFFAFGRWANRTILESVAVLTPEEYARPIGGSFGSVQGTLLHLYGADWVWLERFHERSPRAMPEGEDLTTLEALARKWREVEAGQDSYIATLTQGRLAEPLSYIAFSGDSFTRRLGDALLHLANHGTYHRGQVATLLRQLGRKAASTDYLRFIDAQKG